MAGIPVHTLHPGVRTNATNSVCTGVTWPIYGRRQHWGAEGTSYLSPCLQLQSQIPPPLLHGDCSLRFERTSFVSWFMPTSHSTARMRLLACSQGQPVIDLLQKRRDFWLEQVSPGYRLQLTRKRESCAPAPSPPPPSLLPSAALNIGSPLREQPPHLTGEPAAGARVFNTRLF